MLTTSLPYFYQTFPIAILLYAITHLEPDLKVTHTQFFINVDTLEMVT